MEGSSDPRKASGEVRGSAGIHRTQEVEVKWLDGRPEKGEIEGFHEVTNLRRTLRESRHRSNVSDSLLDTHEAVGDRNVVGTGDEECLRHETPDKHAGVVKEVSGRNRNDLIKEKTFTGRGKGIGRYFQDGLKSEFIGKCPTDPQQGCDGSS